MDARERIRQLSVASPCTADWSAMKGDGAVRHCAACAQNVYNLSALSPEQVASLLESNERVCGRFFRRTDGTIVTRDCAWVWADAKQRARGLLRGNGLLEAGAVSAVVLLVALVLAAVVLFGDNLRKLFGASTTGGLTGPSATRPVKPRGPLRNFGDQSSY